MRDRLAKKQQAEKKEEDQQEQEGEVEDENKKRSAGPGGPTTEIPPQKKRRAPANVWSELTDTDPLVLQSKFTDSAIQVVEDFEPCKDYCKLYKLLP